MTSSSTTDAHQVFVEETPVQLSPTEYRLLRYLILNRDRVLSKDQILDYVWEYDFGGNAGIVETYIGYLRKKLGPSASQPHRDGPRVRLRVCAPSPRVSFAMTLRARLITAVTVLLLVVITVFGFVAVSSQRRVLMAQVDDRTRAGAATNPSAQRSIDPAGVGIDCWLSCPRIPAAIVVASAPSGIEGEMIHCRRRRTFQPLLSTSTQLVTVRRQRRHRLVPSRGADVSRGYRSGGGAAVRRVTAATASLANERLVLAGLGDPDRRGSGGVGDCPPWSAPGRRHDRGQRRSPSGDRRR